jgi:hypothetical protein
MCSHSVQLCALVAPSIITAQHICFLRGLGHARREAASLFPSSPAVAPATLGGYLGLLPDRARFRNERGVDQKVRGLQGVPSRLGHVHAYQTISSSRALSATLNNQ